MNPPTEQLTRDYLNRLSVASKSRLGFRERRALLDQTRARIEFECGGIAEATSARVRQVLATLGDPIALVEAEHARITAGQQAASHAVAEQGAAASGWLGRVPRPRPAALFLDAPVPGGGPVSGGEPEPSAEPEPAAEPEPSAEPESLVAASPPIELDWPTQPELATEAPALSEAEFEAGGESATTPVRRSTLLTDMGSAAASRMALVGSSALELARRHKLEATAVVLLGFGGALYPPIWLIGAFIASFSKIWDIRDKWLGIIVPFLAVLVGTTFIVVFGGVRDTLGSYAFEAWLSAGRLCRLAALAGAGYLLWRLRRGRRRPKQPPWKVPRKLG